MSTNSNLKVVTERNLLLIQSYIYGALKLISQYLQNYDDVLRYIYKKGILCHVVKYFSIISHKYLVIHFVYNKYNVSMGVNSSN